jgi:hypothetical protein
VGFVVEKVDWGRFSPSALVSLLNSHFPDCSMLIIYDPGLVKQAKQWPQSQVDSVLPHEN